jgi:glutamine---fructose-6-phosphate transaminase (isomerizing)
MNTLPASLIASQTLLFNEAAEASAVVARQIAANAALVEALGQRLRDIGPQIIFTCARGSSDHAATFGKYLFETRLGIPTISQAPSISSIYGGPLLHMQGQPFICISQSGKSPDLLLSAKAAREAGALVIAFVNDTSSPLAGIAEIVVPLHAGPEKSVAATKSYIATLAALTHVASAWAQDDDLRSAVNGLPNLLQAAWDADWSVAVPLFQKESSLFVLGRGLTLGIAQEAALKLKETCGLHGEAFSIAEVAHGPMALVTDHFPVLVFPPLDKAVAGLEPTLEKFAARGAMIAVAGKSDGACPLPLPAGLHPVTGPIAMVQAFYGLVNALSIARGRDPDHPPLLQKVTETR